MKKVLSMILSFTLIIGIFAVAPFTVNAVSDYTLNFQAYAQGATNTGWALSNAVETAATVTVDKTIKLTAKINGSTYDPIFFSPNVNLPSTAVDTVKVGLKWTGVTGGVTPQIFFLTDAQTSWAAGDFVQSGGSNTAVDSTGVVEFTFNMSAKLGWKGLISKIRFDPADKAGTYELSYVTFVSNGKAGAAFLKNGATGGTAVTAMSATPGDVITLPANTLTKAPLIFGGWNDGITTYQAGASYTLNNNTTFTAVWNEDSTLPAMGKSWEFNGATTEGWAINQKILATSFKAEGGFLKMTSEMALDSTSYDSRMASPKALVLDPAYSIMKIRMKNVAAGFSSFGSGSVFFTRTADGTPWGISGSRTVNNGFSVLGNTGFVEYTIDLSTHASWTSEVYCFWMDPIRGPNGATADIDYIRIYRKGTSAVNYNKNTTDAVTYMPVNDTLVAKGTGFMLSGQVPNRPGYTFIGWSATPTGSVIANNTVDLTQSSTTYYAQWREILNVTASFDGNGATGTVNPITVVENTSITLPQNSFVKDGYTFTGWSDGINKYSAGATYSMGMGNVTFKPVWNMPTPVLSPATGSTNVDFRNMTVQLTFPVDMDASTITKDNISSTWVQNVTYDSGTKTATVYLKPDSLKYSTTVSFTTTANMASADHLNVLPAFTYSFTTLTEQPEDGENLVTNGDFEQPYISSYASAMALSTDTPSGSGHSLQVTAVSNYTQSKFNVYVKPGAVYQVAYDVKVLGNILGDAATKTQVSGAFKMQAGNDMPFNGPVAQGLSDGWKHIAFYTKDSTNFATMTTGNTYMFLYSNPYNNSGTHYLLDNVSMKEAYPITFGSGTIEGKTITGSVTTAYRIKNATYTLPALAFTTEGYTQTGWTDGTNTYDAGDVVTVGIGGVALTAVWDQDFSASFIDANGATGTAPATIYGQYNESIGGVNITLPANTFTRTGYTFLGWSDGNTTYLPGETYKLTVLSTQFTAVWSQDFAANFTDTNGATGSAPDTIYGQYNESLGGVNITLPENTFAKEGYLFLGWTDGNSTYLPGATYLLTKLSTEFTAVWEQSVFGKMGAQILSGTTAGSASTTLRILTGINRTDCSEVGFIISAVAGIDTLEKAGISENALVIKSNKVYTKVVAEDNDILPDAFNGTYILSLKITDVPNSYFGATFYATVYAVKLDGSTVYGTTTAYSVTDILSSIVG